MWLAVLPCPRQEQDARGVWWLQSKLSRSQRGKGRRGAQVLPTPLLSWSLRPTAGEKGMEKSWRWHEIQRQSSRTTLTISPLPQYRRPAKARGLLMCTPKAALEGCTSAPLNPPCLNPSVDKTVWGPAKGTREGLTPNRLHPGILLRGPVWG